MPDRSKRIVGNNGLPVAENRSPVLFNAVLIVIDEATRRALRIERIDREYVRDGVQ